MDNKFKNLLNNTVIFGIGNIVTKLSQYIVIALCTYCLTTAEVGISEIIVQSVAMLVPMFSADIAEGLFRFSMDKSYSKEQVISNSMAINCIGCVFALIALPIESYFLKSFQSAFFITLLTILEIFQVSIKEFIRGIGFTKLYMLSGFVNATTQIVSCIIYVYFLKLGIIGYILTLLTAYIVEIIFCFFKVNICQYLRKDSITKSLLCELLNYTFPLVPNKVMWWIISALNRYFILWIIGASATGLYSIAAKFPALITVIVSFFFKAWQISAIETCDNKDRDIFYSQIFNLLWSMIGVLTAAAIAVIRYVVAILVSDVFFLSWEYAPFLLLAAAFGAMQSFLGINYTIKKDSIGILRSTSLAAITNIFLNYILIKTIGLQGASIATCLSFIIVMIYRYLDTRKYVTIKISGLYKFVATYAILLTECVFLALYPNLYKTAIIGFISILIINYTIFEKTLILLTPFFKKKK